MDNGSGDGAPAPSRGASPPRRSGRTLVDYRHYVAGTLSNVHVQGSKRNVIVFALPRSGSTFLMELLAAQPGMKVYNEPFTVHYAVSRRELGIESWEELTVGDDRRERYGRFIERLLANRVKELNPRFYRADRQLLSTRVTIKNIHAGKDIIPWFAETFRLMIAVLIRHPIPTALSHRILPRLPFLLRQKEHRALFDNSEIAFAERIIAQGPKFDQSILNWALETGAMFRNPAPGALVISYEDLTVYPHESFAFMREHLDLAPVADIDRLVSRASGSTVQSDPAVQHFFDAAAGTADRRFLIERWTEKVTPTQIDRAFEICDRLKIDVYRSGSFFPTPKYRVPGLQPEQGSVQPATPDPPASG